MRSLFATCCLVAALLLMSPIFAAAQTRATSGDVAGTVSDTTGAVVAGVQITAQHHETGVERSVQSRADGRYDLPSLPLGLYTIRAELSGFTPASVESVLVTLGSVTEVAIVLRPASVQVTVVVEAATRSDPQRIVVSNTITREQIEALPINGRNFLSFSKLTPTVSADRMPVQGSAATSGLSFSGQHGRSNNLTVDGLDNNDEVIGAVRATFSQEAVREFQVLANSYSAEFGRASGGVINIVTKSGTNTLSGTVFGYVRDDTLNAKEYFERVDPAGRSLNQQKAPFSQRQIGGTFGGPLVQNRSFFFGSYERLDVEANNFVNIDSTTPVLLPGRPASTAVDILRAAGFPIQTGHVPYDIWSNQFVVKLDHNFRAADSLVLRYNYGGGYNGNLESWGGLIAESRGAALDNRDHMFAASYSTIRGARLVNELRFQVAGRKQGIISLDPTCAGPCDDVDEGGPTVEVPGIASIGRQRTTPERRRNTRYQMLDTVSYQAGDHLWKAGVDLNFIDHRSASLPLQFGGRFIFAPLPAIPGLLPAPVTSIQAVALGLPAAYVQGYGNPNTEFLTSDLSLFLQDQWRLGPALTVNAGVRYQLQGRQDRVYNVAGLSSYRIPSDRNNVAPRLGASWSLDREMRTTVHGSYGIYYDNVISAITGVADIVNGSPNGLRTLVLRFPQSIAAWNTPARRLPEPTTPYPSLIVSVDPGLKTSYTHQVSAGVDRRLGNATVIAVNFVRVRGFNQLGTIDYNPLVASLGTGRRPEDVNGVPGTSASILQYSSYGQTWYRALTTTVSTRLGTRLQGQASYVLSKAEDNTSDFQSAFIPQDNGRGRDRANPKGLPVGFNPLSERGPSQQDQRHSVVVSGMAILPGAVQLSLIATASSGVPFNILAGTDLNGDGDGGTFPTDRARTDPARPESSVARNAGRLPSDATMDLRVSRQFRLTGDVTLEPLFEVFNLFDRANFTEVNGVFGTGSYPNNPLLTYGQFLRAASMRQAQVGLKLRF